MKKPILLDTDVLVDFLRGRPAAVAYMKAHADRIILSSLVAAELYAGARNDDERLRLDEFLAMFPVVPVTLDLAQAAGSHQRDYRASHGTGLADAVIAATAVARGAELKTFNAKHYPMFKGLKPPYDER